MKKFSIRLLMLAALVSIACSAYTPKTIHHLAAPAAAAPAAKTSQMFYWFMAAGDYFDDYADLSYQISQMEIYTGGLVDTTPPGITVEFGYAFPYLPHTMMPQVALYLHL